MTLEEFLKPFDGGACISIEGYCDESNYDYIMLPDEEEEDFLGNNPNHYIPSCLVKETWYEKVKNKEVKRWVIIGGGRSPVELYIEVE